MFDSLYLLERAKSIIYESLFICLACYFSFPKGRCSGDIATLCMKTRFSGQFNEEPNGI